MTSRDLTVPTTQGPGRWLLDEAADPRLALLLGHGAGGGPQSPDLALLATRLPRLGITVARFEQPWRTAGRRVAVAPPRLDQAWLEALPVLRAALPTGQPLATGGRSAGARVACRTAGVVGAVAVLCLAFPLHPPGRPDRSRAPELLTPAVPRLVLQGTRDTLGSPDEVRAAVAGDPGVRVVDLAGADHGYRLPAGGSRADLQERVLAEVAVLLDAAGCTGSADPGE